MTSMPMMDPVPGYTSPEYSTDITVPGGASSSTAQTAAPDDPSLAATCVLCVWAAHEAQRTPEANTFAIMSVHHKASVEEDTVDGVTWWSRACQTDREAIALVDSALAHLLQQDADLYTRPQNLKPRPCTATSGSVLTDNHFASQAW